MLHEGSLGGKLALKCMRTFNRLSMNATEQMACRRQRPFMEALLNMPLCTRAELSYILGAEGP